AAQLAAALEALDEGLLQEVLGRVADAAPEEGEELTVRRDQLAQHVLGQARIPVAHRRSEVSDRKRRSRSELANTDTLDIDIAALAYTGDRPMPSPAKAPAAIGMPVRL